MTASETPLFHEMPFHLHINIKGDQKKAEKNILSEQNLLRNKTEEKKISDWE